MIANIILKVGVMWPIKPNPFGKQLQYFDCILAIEAVFDRQYIVDNLAFLLICLSVVFLSLECIAKVVMLSRKSKSARLGLGKF